MERRAVICVQVREMESKLKQYGVSEMTTNPQDFISRKDHARICDSRVSAREADLQVSWGCWPQPLLPHLFPPSTGPNPFITAVGDFRLMAFSKLMDV